MADAQVQEDECVNVEGLLASISLECVAIYSIELVVLFKVISGNVWFSTLETFNFFKTFYVRIIGLFVLFFSQFFCFKKLKF